MDWIKTISDKLILWFLHASSGFGKELTREGRVEQEMWREQRLRNLKGLAAIRSRQSLDADKVSTEQDK